MIDNAERLCAAALLYFSAPQQRENLHAPWHTEPERRAARYGHGNGATADSSFMDRYREIMTALDGALWGFLGGAVAEALTLYSLMRPTGRRRNWRWPWATKQDRPAVLFAMCLRLFAGGGLATPLGVSGQIASEFGLFICGAAAPLVVARLFQLIPVSDMSESFSDSK